MKKILLPCAILAACLMTGCATVKTYTAKSNEISSQAVAVNTYFDKSDYQIIGTATGTSDYVWYSAVDGDYKGDSLNYGYVYEPKGLNLGENLFVGTGKEVSKHIHSPYKATLAKEDPYILNIAKLNANYELIENVYTLGGDSIFDPVYSVEKIVEEEHGAIIIKYKVTVRATVIKFIKK